MSYGGGFVDLQIGDDGSCSAHVHAGRDASRAYGGSVLANALGALYEHVGEGRDVNSLHGYFLRPVDARMPLVLAHEEIRTGRNYAVHQIVGSQEGKTRVTFTASFKVPTPSVFERQAEFPDVPGPEGLPDGFAERAADLTADGVTIEARLPRGLTSDLPDTMEMRAVPPERGAREGELVRHNWYRMRHDLPDTAAAHAAALAYICDVNLAPTAMLRFPKGAVPKHMIASLDHAMWFHEAPRFDGWVLYAQHSRVERDGRTWARGDLWTQDGRLLSSVAQEALLLVDEPVE